MPTPEPTPIPVYLVDPAPALWSPDWWIDAGIPLLGALGSIAVAVVAVALTWRLARRDSDDRARSRRAGFAVTLDGYLDPRVEPGQSDSSLAEMHHRLQRGLRTAAAATGGGATAIGEWIFNEQAGLVSRHTVSPDDADPDYQWVAQDRATLIWVVGARVRDWVGTGQMDFSDIDYGDDNEAF